MKTSGIRWIWIGLFLVAFVSVGMFIRTAGLKEKIDRERAILNHVSFDLISIERSLLAVDRHLARTPPAPHRVVLGFLAQGKAALSDIAMYRPFPLESSGDRFNVLSKRFGTLEKSVIHPPSAQQFFPDDRPTAGLIALFLFRIDIPGACPTWSTGSELSLINRKTKST